MKRLGKYTLRLLLGITVLYLILLIPLPAEQLPKGSSATPFLWDRDEHWQYLEQQFQEAKTQTPLRLDTTINRLMTQSEQFFLTLEREQFPPEDAIFTVLQEDFFTIAPYIAARPVHTKRLIAYYNRVRNWTKQQSQHWNMKEEAARKTLYRMLYGMRAAVEEVLLQDEGRNYPAAMLVNEEASATLSTDILGIQVHSGDLLVSRGGAAASAFISRGNDYPGNFSHVAIIFIDDSTQTPYLVEAHIERGVALASVEEYLKDKKLRFMVLRPRIDLPQLEANPQLPQLAAQLAYDECNARHIPYDFKMDFYDSTAMFCSEVGSYAYRKQGLQLWKAVSTISSQGVVNWLHTFGVENFVTQMPSDLEYDPQLSVVGEWRDPETLYKDHIDNAVMDAMWVAADAGKKIDYPFYLLPVARMIKAYCMILNLFGKEGMIPEGMSASRALKNNSFTEKYAQIREETAQAAADFKHKNGYVPPFWKLVSMAEDAEKRLNLFKK